jgi:hypothetical protein
MNINDMIIQYTIILILLSLSISSLILSYFLIHKNKHPILKVIVSGFIFILIAFIGLLLTAFSNYKTSDYIDITTIYFVLGFANFVIYFVFFNKRK